MSQPYIKTKFTNTNDIYLQDPCLTTLGHESNSNLIDINSNNKKVYPQENPLGKYLEKLNFFKQKHILFAGSATTTNAFTNKRLKNHSGTYNKNDDKLAKDIRNNYSRNFILMKAWKNNLNMTQKRDYNNNNTNNKTKTNSNNGRSTVGSSNININENSFKKGKSYGGGTIEHQKLTELEKESGNIRPITARKSKSIIGEVNKSNQNIEDRKGQFLKSITSQNKNETMKINNEKELTQSMINKVFSKQNSSNNANDQNGSAKSEKNSQIKRVIKDSSVNGSSSKHSVNGAPTNKRNSNGNFKFLKYELLQNFLVYLKNKENPRLSTQSNTKSLDNKKGDSSSYTSGSKPKIPSFESFLSPRNVTFSQSLQFKTNATNNSNISQVKSPQSITSTTERKMKPFQRATSTAGLLHQKEKMNLNSLKDIIQTDSYQKELMDDITLSAVRKNNHRDMISSVKKEPRASLDSLTIGYSEFSIDTTSNSSLNYYKFTTNSSNNQDSTLKIITPPKSKGINLNDHNNLSNHATYETNTMELSNSPVNVGQNSILKKIKPNIMKSIKSESISYSVTDVSLKNSGNRPGNINHFMAPNMQKRASINTISTTNYHNHTRENHKIFNSYTSSNESPNRDNIPSSPTHSRSPLHEETSKHFEFDLNLINDNNIPIEMIINSMENEIKSLQNTNGQSLESQVDKKILKNLLDSSIKGILNQIKRKEQTLKDAIHLDANHHTLNYTTQSMRSNSDNDTDIDVNGYLNLRSYSSSLSPKKIKREELEQIIEVTEICSPNGLNESKYKYKNTAPSEIKKIRSYSAPILLNYWPGYQNHSPNDSMDISWSFYEEAKSVDGYLLNLMKGTPSHSRQISNNGVDEFSINSFNENQVNNLEIEYDILMNKSVNSMYPPHNAYYVQVKDQNGIILEEENSELQ